MLRYFLLFLILIFPVYGFSASSDNFETDLSLSSIAVDASSVNYKTDITGKTVLQQDDIPAQDTPSTPPKKSGGGGGGGGSSSSSVVCIPIYDCPDWSKCLNNRHSRVCVETNCGYADLVEYDDCISESVEVPISQPVIPEPIPVEDITPIEHFLESKESNYWFYIIPSLIFIVISIFGYLAYNKRTLQPKQKVIPKDKFLQELNKTIFAIDNDNRNLAIDHYTNIYNIFNKLAPEDQQKFYPQLVNLVNEIKKL